MIAISRIPVALLLALVITTQRAPAADDKYGPADPIAAIDGQPVFLGELNLILTERLKVRNLDRIGIEVQQATAALLVRRHLAMKSLRAEGGELLEAMIQRQIEAYASEAKRRGSSLAEQAGARLADERSLTADLAWRAAWSQYLKSRLNDQNLRRFFDQHRDRYAGNRWEVSQIFVKMETRDGASVKAAAENLADLATQIAAASDKANAFADAARQHSDSPSAADGGMVGWVEHDGDLPRAVMAAIRNTAAGGITPPVASPLGMHLVFVHQEQPGKLTFDDLTEQAQLRRDAADALFDALVGRQRRAKVTWFISALRPPPGVSIFPE